jgi:Protein of unknown function (DUF2867)
MSAVVEIALPRNAAISSYYEGANFADSYAISIGADSRSALALYLDIVSRTPTWVDTMMSARNRLVSMFGLKNIGALKRVDLDKPLSSYRIGDRAGIFSLLYQSDDEVILGDSDRHLDAKVSVRRATQDAISSLQVTTVVHIKNGLGHAYMAVVAPAHRRIVPAVLTRYVTKQ